MDENSTKLDDSEDLLPEIHRYEDYLVAGLILIIGSIGIIVHIKNLFDYRKDSQPMTYLIRVRTVADMLVISTFLTYAMPVALFALDNVKEGYWNRISDWIASWAYTYIVLLDPLVAANRFIAICYPFRYERIFSKRSTMALLLFALVTSMGAIMFDLIGEDCVYSFDYFWLTWDFPDTPCGRASEMYGCLVPAYICSAVAFGLNLIICTKLLLFECRKKPDAVNTRRGNVHIRFFIQSCIQYTIFLLDLIVFTVVEEPESRLLTFIYYSWIWMTLHTVDGLVIFWFRPKRPKETATQVVSMRTKSVSQVT